MAKEKTKKKGRRIVLIILLIVLAFLLTAVISAYAFYKSKLKRIPRSDGIPTTEVTIDETDSALQQFDSDMKDQIENLPEDEKDQQTKEAMIDIFRDSDVFNILLIGTDERSTKFSDHARGDTCMLLSLNKKDYSIRLVSFERGMGVPILEGKYQGKYDWLTHSFAYGGANLMMREIRECFKVDVDRYVRVNFASFKQGIDAVGGVDINLTEAEAEYIRTSHPSSGIYAGWNHLDGEYALMYARCRKIDSDWNRIRRQRTVVQAAMNQLRDMSLSELNDALNGLLPLVMTNLTDEQITNLLLIAPKFQGKTAEQMTIPVKGSYGGMIGLGGRSLFSVDFNRNAIILRDFLYPNIAPQEPEQSEQPSGIHSDGEPGNDPTNNHG